MSAKVTKGNTASWSETWDYIAGYRIVIVGSYMDVLVCICGCCREFSISLSPKLFCCFCAYRYLGVDEQTMTMEFEGLGLSRQLLGTCVPISAHSDSHPESLSSSRQKYRQVRHNINTDISQSYSVMPGVRPSFR